MSAIPNAAIFPTVSALTGRPKTFSAAMKNRCPPSSGKMGSRLKTARFMLIRARSCAKLCAPSEATSLLTETTPIGLDTES